MRTDHIQFRHHNEIKGVKLVHGRKPTFHIIVLSINEEHSFKNSKKNFGRDFQTKES